MDPKLTGKASGAELDLELGSGSEVEIAKGVEKTKTFRIGPKRYVLEREICRALYAGY
jgi:hypothetical protein